MKLDPDAKSHREAVTAALEADIAFALAHAEPDAPDLARKITLHLAVRGWL